MQNNDLIHSLPTSYTDKISIEDSKMLDSMLSFVDKQHVPASKVARVMEMLKPAFFLFGLLIVVNLSFVSSMISSVVPYSSYSLILTMAKALIITLCFFLLVKKIG